MTKKEVVLNKITPSSNNKILQTFVILGGIAISWFLFSQMYNEISFFNWLIIQFFITFLAGMCYMGLVEKVFFVCPYCKTELQVANEPIAVDCPRCRERILIKWKNNEHK